MENKTRFTLTADHVKLIQRIDFMWSRGYPIGSPCISTYRPYGNSDVWQDVAEFLDIEMIADGPRDQDCYKPEDFERMKAAHNSMSTALSVCTALLTFEPGEYELRDEWNKLSWKKVDE